ncbi:M48 family metallopeptidase [Poseidonibacter antarcticus]|uniref:M48 family metallopeptidase n=1 Tax=Poseidonibacter antarcticus TaxID=2478538 RepID=UPI000EF4D7A9|nr:SprT family zinc-dependent metalloprotease [Poseidonibacter antarcticus]
MEFEHNIDSLVLTVKFENKRHIKHCYLRVINNNLIHIKANINFTYLDALELLERKKNWLIKALSHINQTQLNDDEFLYFGEIKKLYDYKIKNIDKFYRESIEKVIPSLVEKYSKLMNLYPTSIKYRKNKRTWGSCNYKNGLNFNTQLCKFPIEIAQYVVVHELAHIKHKNHSKKFWNLVECYCPDYKEREKLFKTLL